MWTTFSSKSQYLAITLLASSMYYSSVSALDIKDYFTVATSGGGSCQNYMTDLGNYLQEAFDIAAAGLNAITALENHQARFTDARHFVMMFEVDTVSYFKGKYALSSDDLANIAYVKNTFGLITPDGIKGIKPRLYCDSQMLIYTETGYDKETGEKTQQPLQDALGGFALPGGQKGAYWSPDDKNYNFELDSTTENTPCKGTVDAFRIPSTDTIILCPYLLSGSKKKSLASYASGQTAINNGDNINDYNSIPGTFMHEMVHLVKSDIIDQPAYDDNLKKLTTSAYGYEALTNLAAAVPENARFNADTYHYFGMASYLKTKDWAAGEADDVKLVPASS